MWSVWTYSSVVHFLASEIPNHDALFTTFQAVSEAEKQHRCTHTLSREEDRIIFGFSGVVAIAVTHPPCPRRVPRRCNESAIVSAILRHTSALDGLHSGACSKMALTYSKECGNPMLHSLAEWMAPSSHRTNAIKLKRRIKNCLGSVDAFFSGLHRNRRNSHWKRNQDRRHVSQRGWRG